mgnify:CR=1 FL=1
MTWACRICIIYHLGTHVFNINRNHEGDKGGVRILKEPQLTKWKRVIQPKSKEGLDHKEINTKTLGSLNNNIVSDEPKVYWSHRGGFYNHCLPIFLEVISRCTFSYGSWLGFTFDKYH